MLLLSAILTGLCFAWYKAGFIAFFTLIPMFLILLSETDAPKKKPLRFYGYGYFWGAAFFATVFHWFRYQYPLEYLGFSKAEAIGYVALTWFGSGLLLSVILALFHLSVGLFLRSGLCRRHRFLLIPFSAAAYVLVEFAFTLGSLATPWARLAITQQSNILFIQTASVFGSYFISSLIVAVNAALALGVYTLIFDKNKKAAGILAATAAAMLILNTAAGAVLYVVDDACEDQTNCASVAALQGNMISGRADLPLGETVDLFLQMSEDHINESVTDLIVMPEGCFSMDVERRTDVTERLTQFCVDHNVSIIFGAYEYAEDGFYNVTWCISNSGELSGPYRKQHPVPFGEFTPARDLILAVMPFLEDVTNIGDDLSAGSDSTVFETGRGTVGAFICFDSAFENIGYEETRKGALILTESTNDSWWMDSSQLYEHNGHAVLRAVESRRYYVRSASAGYSTLIDPRGRIVDSVPALTAGFASGDAALRGDLSFYHRTPYLFPAVCAVIFAGGYVWALIYKIRAKRRCF